MYVRIIYSTLLFVFIGDRLGLVFGSILYCNVTIIIHVTWKHSTEKDEKRKKTTAALTTKFVSTVSSSRTHNTRVICQVTCKRNPRETLTRVCRWWRWRRQQCTLLLIRRVQNHCVRRVCNIASCIVVI